MRSVAPVTLNGWHREGRSGAHSWLSGLSERQEARPEAGCSQTTGVPGTQRPARVSQVSRPLHALPSVHCASDVQAGGGVDWRVHTPSVQANDDAQSALLLQAMVTQRPSVHWRSAVQSVCALQRAAQKQVRAGSSELDDMHTRSSSGHPWSASAKPQIAPVTRPQFDWAATGCAIRMTSAAGIAARIAKNQRLPAFRPSISALPLKRLVDAARAP